MRRTSRSVTVPVAMNKRVIVLRAGSEGLKGSKEQLAFIYLSTSSFFGAWRRRVLSASSSLITFAKLIDLFKIFSTFMSQETVTLTYQPVIVMQTRFKSTNTSMYVRRNSVSKFTRFPYPSQRRCWPGWTGMDADKLRVGSDFQWESLLN